MPPSQTSPSPEQAPFLVRMVASDGVMVRVNMEGSKYLRVDPLCVFLNIHDWNIAAGELRDQLSKEIARFIEIAKANPIHNIYEGAALEHAVREAAFATSAKLDYVLTDTRQQYVSYEIKIDPANWCCVAHTIQKRGASDMLEVRLEFGNERPAFVEKLRVSP